MILTVLTLSVFMHSGAIERPHLTLAQGFVESRLNPNAVGSCGEKGAWQAREKYWGTVPKGLLRQAKHAEGILNKIKDANNCSLYKALILYNGSGKRAQQYAVKVLRHTLELAVIIMPETSKIDVLRS